jgi:hypothetical protein
VIHEPADADPSPFDCWSCGKPMAAIFESRTRICQDCGVLELRHQDTYIPRVRIEKELVTGNWVVPYLDHGSGHYPSPA